MAGIISLQNFIDGKSTSIGAEGDIILNDIYDIPRLRIETAGAWTIEAAIETATRLQPTLKKIPRKNVIKVLIKAMDYFFADKDDYHFLAVMSGADFNFLQNSIEQTKEWIRHSDKFCEKIFPEATIDWQPSSPVFAILPNNSEQEVPFIAAQILLARCSGIFRPSSKGIGAYTCLQFCQAVVKAVDSFNDQNLLPIKSALSYLNIPSGLDFISTLAIDNWNYIFFGEDKTVRMLAGKLKEFAQPRQIFNYGTGLGMSIVFADADLDKYIKDIALSVVNNRGNECVDTDVIYAEAPIADQLEKRLKSEILEYNNQIDGENTCGILLPENAENLYEILAQKGFAQYINLRHDEKNNYIFHSAIIPISRFSSCMEYPGPVVFIRSFQSQQELLELIQKDLDDNDKRKNLVTSIYTQSNIKFQNVIPELHSYTIKLNEPTHIVHLDQPFQGIFLSKELCTPTLILDNKK